MMAIKWTTTLQYTYDRLVKVIQAIEEARENAE